MIFEWNKFLSNKSFTYEHLLNSLTSLKVEESDQLEIEAGQSWENIRRHAYFFTFVLIISQVCLGTSETPLLGLSAKIGSRFSEPHKFLGETLVFLKPYVID